MRRTKWMLAVALVGLTAGCTSYEERVARTCTNLGAGPGTANYWDCVRMREEINARDRAMWGGVAVSGAAIAAQPAPRPAVTCTTWGGYTVCN